MKVRKLLATLLALAMTLSMLSVGALATENEENGVMPISETEQTAPVSTLPADAAASWASKAFERWSAVGIVKGDNDGNMNPDAFISRAELAAMLDRLMDYQTKSENTFTDVAADAWYTESVLAANAAGVLQGSEKSLRPEAPITRQEVAVVFARVLGLSGNEGASAGYTDAAEIAPWALDGMLSMVASGYIKGNDGLLRPTANITRAEVVTILDNAFKSYIDKAGTYTESVTGTVLVSAADVVLKGMTITGDLIIAEGVGDGNVTLDKTTVTGNVVVRGGGINSIHIKGGSKVGSVTVARQDGAVRIETSSDSTVTMVYINDGKDDVIIEGKFDSVQVSAEVPVVLQNATVKTVTATGENANVTVDKGSKVDTVATGKTGTTITVAGTVTNVAATADATGVSLNVSKGGTATNVVTAAAGSTVSNDGKVGTLSMTKDADTKYVAGDNSTMPKFVAEDKTGLTVTTAAAEKAAAEKAAAEKALAEATTDEAKAAAEAAKAAADKAAAAAKAAADKAAADAAKKTEEKPVTPPTIADDGKVDVPPAPPSTGGSTGGSSGGSSTTTLSGYYPATISDVSGVYTNSEVVNNYSVTATQTSGDNYVKIAVSAADLQYHENGQNRLGYWAGAAIPVPEGADAVKSLYKIGAGAFATPDTSLGSFDSITQQSGAAIPGNFATIYGNTNVGNKIYFSIKWVKADNTEITTTNYLIDLSGVNTALPAMIKTLPVGATAKFTGENEITLTGTVAHGLTAADLNYSVINAALVGEGVAATNITLQLPGGNGTIKQTNPALKYYMIDGGCGDTIKIVNAEYVKVKNSYGTSAVDYDVAVLANMPVKVEAGGKTYTIKNSLTINNLPNAYTLTDDVTVAAGQTLSIAEGKTITVPADKTLTINGTFVNNGTLTNNGTKNGIGTSIGVSYAESWIDTLVTSLGSDNGKTDTTWDKVITATHYYDTAKTYVDALGSGDVKTALAARLAAVKAKFAEITVLDMSGKAESTYTISSDALRLFTGLTELDISGTGIAEFTGLTGMTGMTKLNLADLTGFNAGGFGALAAMRLTYLNLSGTKVADIGALGSAAMSCAATLVELDISNTNVTVLQGAFWVDGAPTFTALKTLNAKGLRLTSISGLVEVVNVSGFNPNGITWNLDTSTLTDGGDNSAHVARITEVLGAGFTAPEVTPV